MKTSRTSKLLMFTLHEEPSTVYQLTLHLSHIIVFPGSGNK